MAEKLVNDGLTDADKLKDIMKKNIETEPLAKIDYVEAVNFDDISVTDTISDNTLVAIAVYIGKTRLIDNFLIKRK